MHNGPDNTSSCRDLRDCPEPHRQVGIADERPQVSYRHVWLFIDIVYLANFHASVVVILLIA